MRPPSFVTTSLVVVALAAVACGGKKSEPAGGTEKAGGAAKAAKTVPTTPHTVGAFTIGVPATWGDVSSDRAQAGQVGFQHRTKPSVVLILSPAPTPMPFDPTDPQACADAGARMPGVQAQPTVVDLPAGKACVVKSRETTHMTMTVLAVGDQGVMAQCQSQDPGDAAECEPLVRSLALAK